MPIIAGSIGEFGVMIAADAIIVDNPNRDLKAGCQLVSRHCLDVKAPLDEKPDLCCGRHGNQTG